MAPHGATYSSAIDGLRSIYHTKIQPLEELYHFDQFHSPCLTDLEALPMVLLLGQYSTGKTTFVEYLLGRPYPGAHIGPEPTTDKWVAVMKSNTGGSAACEDLVIPGNAAAVQADKPFNGLSRFGSSFLSKFQVSCCDAAILDSVTLIDTPGVLAGDKQKLGRSYDFVKVCEWFAERADLILLLFDAHKLDVSDELKRVIEALRPHDDKVKIVLNKADGVSEQQLMRVYGALMWSLGKVINTPEVMRVYIGSFWSGKKEHLLLQQEEQDLMNDLHALPRNAITRKINDVVKRARLAKVHAYIVTHLRSLMPVMFGRSSKQQKLLNNLAHEFTVIHRQYNLPPGDFPDLHRFREALSSFDISAFAKLHTRMIKEMDDVLSRDLPLLMQQFPPDHGALARAFRGTSNPFSNESFGVEVLTKEDDRIHRELFRAHAKDGKLSGPKARDLFTSQTGLPSEDLAVIWMLADADCDGALNEAEFSKAMHLIRLKLAGQELPR